jgi:hypothetical protein
MIKKIDDDCNLAELVYKVNEIIDYINEHNFDSLHDIFDNKKCNCQKDMNEMIKQPQNQIIEKIKNANKYAIYGTILSLVTNEKNLKEMELFISLKEIEIEGFIESIKNKKI